jgi:alkaline phosphatase D
VAINPHVRYATGRQRGYLRFDLTPRRLLAELRGVDSVREPTSGCATQASFVVEEGRAGAQADSA